MKKLIVAAALCSVVASAGARDIGVAIHSGSAGLGLHLSTQLMEKLNVRGGFNYFSYSMSLEASKVKYDATLKLQTIDLLLDYHPFDGAFRLTAGGIYNSNGFDVTAQSTDGTNYQFDGKTFNASQAGSVKGKIKFNSIAPYLGIGWGNAVDKGKKWGFVADVGLILQGSPDASLTNEGCTLQAPMSCEDLRQSLAKESANLNKEVEGFQYYPVVRLGLSYKF